MAQNKCLKYPIQWECYLGISSIFPYQWNFKNIIARQCIFKMWQLQLWRSHPWICIKHPRMELKHIHHVLVVALANIRSHLQVLSTGYRFTKIQASVQYFSVDCAGVLWEIHLGSEAKILVVNKSTATFWLSFVTRFFKHTERSISTINTRGQMTVEAHLKNVLESANKDISNCWWSWLQRPPQFLFEGDYNSQFVWEVYREWLKLFYFRKSCF